MKYYIIILLTFVGLVSCNKSDDNNNDCVENEIAYVTSVDADSTGLVNEKVEIKVNFNLRNSCGIFQDFTESIDLASRTIKVNAVYDGCACLQVIKPETVTYIFETSTAGDYELKFKSGENDYIIVVISIV